MTKKSHDNTKARQYLTGVLSAAESYQSDGFDVNEEILDMRNRFDLPHYQWAWLDGYRACRQDHWQRYCLIYCLIWQGVPIKMDWDTLTEEQKEYCRKTSYENMSSGHFWLNKDGSIGRPYYTPAVSAKYDESMVKRTNNGLNHPAMARQLNTTPTPSDYALAQGSQKEVY